MFEPTQNVLTLQSAGVSVVDQNNNEKVVHGADIKELIY